MFDAHAAKKVAGGDVNSACVFIGKGRCLVANATNKAVAFDNHIDILGGQQLHPAEERVDVNFFIFADDRLTQVQTYATTKRVESCAMESFTFIDVFISTEPHSATNALAILTHRQGALEPL